MKFLRAEAEILGIFLLMVATYWVLQISAKLFNNASTIDWFTGLFVFLGLLIIWVSVIRRITLQLQKYFSKGPQA